MAIMPLPARGSIGNLPIGTCAGACGEAEGFPASAKSLYSLVTPERFVAAAAKLQKTNSNKAAK